MGATRIGFGGVEITTADDDELWHDAAVPGHIREAATPGEYLDKPRPGIILADCSCGAEYEAPQGPDEYGALEKAHRAHVAAASAPRKGQVVRFRRADIFGQTIDSEASQGLG